MISHMQRPATKLLHDSHARDRQISRASLCVWFQMAATQSCTHTHRERNTKQKQVATAAAPSILLQQGGVKWRELNPEDNLMLFLVHICSMNQPQKLVFRINSENL